MKETTNAEKVVVLFGTVMIIIFIVFLLASLWELFHNGFSNSFIAKGFGTIIVYLIIQKIGNSIK